VTNPFNDPQSPYSFAKHAHETGLTSMPSAAPARPHFDTLEFGAVSAPPARRRGRAPVIIASAVVLVLLMGAAAVAGAYVWFGWGATQPEQVLPSSTAAFARIDLSPGLGQRLKVEQLARKFPRHGDATQVDDLRRSIIEGLNLQPLDFDADVRPWFADRVGYALWGYDTKQGVCTLTALASKDDAKAATALAKVREHREDDRFGYAFLDGYAVTASCPATGAQVMAEAAVAAAKTSSLAQRASFASAVAELPAGQLALGWVDLSAIPTLMASLGERTPVTAGLDKLAGQLVFGARAVDNGVEVRYRWQGLTSIKAGRDVLADLGALPGNTVLAAGTDLSAMTWAQDTLERQIESGVAELGAQGGVVRDGLQALLRSVITVAVAQPTTGTGTALRIVARAPGATEAAAIAALVDAIHGDAGALPAGLTVRRTADGVEVSTGDYRADATVLSADPLFREAVAGAAEPAAAAIYVDVQRYAANTRLDAEARARLAPVKAVAFSTGFDRGAVVGLLRVVIR
jgi:Protein of unknown function (DUF3352)